jgi:hypothetical protein
VEKSLFLGVAKLLILPEHLLPLLELPLLICLAMVVLEILAVQETQAG